MKITFIFILILFIDSVNRVYRVQVELAAATEGGSNNGYVSITSFLITKTAHRKPATRQRKLTMPTSQSRAAIMGHERLEVQARKFYSQRNMYLCGFTLFLSLILNRTYIMILEVLRLEEKIKLYEGTTAKGAKESEKLAAAGEPGEIARLRKALAEKDRDIDTLKKQAAGLHKEYFEMGDRLAASGGQVDGTPKKDK
jgi:B-cell receptor-associated protein 31